VPGATSNAYTAAALPLHMDLPAREYQPGIQFLHCLANEGQGGHSIYCHGLAVAERLWVEDGAAFQVLSETQIIFRYHDEDTDYQMLAPLTGLDRDGAVWETRFNAAIMTIDEYSPAAYREFQRAHRRFLALTRDPDQRVERRMRPREIAVFDKRRVLHDRHAFSEGTGEGGRRRHRQGAYVEWEDVNSKIRVLRRHLY
jgi:gamma-butyrobetaine dioxygenase